MRICFDMDGTIANLYGVEGWLEMLINSDPTPYEVAAAMLNMSALARRLNKLQKAGYEIGIISWLSKGGNCCYHQQIISAKLAWLKKHLKSVKFDFVEIVPYGTPKSFVCSSPDDILFDDEERNRKEWKGVAYDVNNILEVLKSVG